MFDKNRHHGCHTQNVSKAKQLRRDMTKQEKHLWYDFLRSCPVHFYRQRPVDHYILDSCCIEARLVIELDGDRHGEPVAAEYDLARTETLKHDGLEVLRIPNSDVDRSFGSVCHTIREKVKERLRMLGNSDHADALEEWETTWNEYAVQRQ